MKQPIKIQIQCLLGFLSTFFVFLYFLHFIFKLINYFLAVLGLRCCAWGGAGATLCCCVRASHCGSFSC